MAKLGTINTAVLLTDGLQAGFLYNQRKTTKEYGAFSVEEVECEGPHINYVRACTRAEKRKLARMVYADRCVAGRNGYTVGGYPCELFVTK